VEDLGTTRYDLLVIGGGAHGLFAAADAASRGLSVALIDKADFGGGVSWPDQRTIGGAFQSFREGQLGRSRRRIRERRAWARLAPHLLRPLPFLAGTYRWTRRSRTLAKAAFQVFDGLGRHRNAHVSPELHLPKARLESAAATRRLFPGVAEAGLTGGAIWYDYQARDPERLTWTVALAARREGAALANYVEAIGAVREGAGRVGGAQVRDPLSGELGEIRAAVTLVATTGGSQALLASMGVATGQVPVLRTMDVLLNRPARDIALVAPARSGRLLTAVPWHGYLLVGTHVSKRPVDAHASVPPDEAIDAFLGDVNDAFPSLGATRRDIRLLHHGLVPADVRGDRVERLAEPRIVRHARAGAAGLVSLTGAEYTMARWAAERAIDAVCAELGRGAGACRTGHFELPHAGIADVEGRLVETLREIRVELDRDVIDHLIRWYGTEASAVARHAAGAGLVDRVSPGTPILAGAIAYAVEREAAVRLSDVVFRRTPIGSAGRPCAEALERVASIMGGRLGWTVERRAAELADLETDYRAITAAAP
jgi:glycerol-3-phosphate dehydrogenase